MEKKNFRGDVGPGRIAFEGRIEAVPPRRPKRPGAGSAGMLPACGRSRLAGTCRQDAGAPSRIASVQRYGETVPMRPLTRAQPGNTLRGGPADPAGIVLQATSLAVFTGRSRPVDFGRRGRLPHYDLVGVPSCARRPGAQLGTRTMHRDMDCGGKRSATPLWIGDRQAKALSPLRSASALQMLRLARFHNGACAKLRPQTRRACRHYRHRPGGACISQGVHG